MYPISSITVQEKKSPLFTTLLPRLLKVFAHSKTTRHLSPSDPPGRPLSGSIRYQVHYHPASASHPPPVPVSSARSALSFARFCVHAAGQELAATATATKGDQTAGIDEADGIETGPESDRAKAKQHCTTHLRGPGRRSLMSCAATGAAPVTTPQSSPRFGVVDWISTLQFCFIAVMEYSYMLFCVRTCLIPNFFWFSKL